MQDQEASIAFGPVPSRRLGRSLGVNNIPPKICSYSCIYCQIGRTLRFSDQRMEYYEPERIFSEVQEKVTLAERRSEKIDYITFVPDGEPTLDIHLGKEIALLKELGKKVAVITNSSIMGREDVRLSLGAADLVSIKLDAASVKVWKQLNRPKRTLALHTILDGILAFSRGYNGALITETMLVRGVNDDVNEIAGIAQVLSEIKPVMSYISIPIRPPAEPWVEPVDERTLSIAYILFANRSLNTEHLIGYEGNAFSFTGDIEKDLLSITSVHPMRKDAVCKYLEKANSNWKEVKNLIESEKLSEVRYKQDTFYVRKLR